MQDKQKRDNVEWSFSFAELGEKIDEFVRSFGQSGEEAIKSAALNEPLGAAASARVRIDLPVCETYIHSAPADTLINANLTYIGEINFTVTGETEKIVNLSQKAGPSDWMRGVFGWIGSKGGLRWNIGLGTGAPLALDIHSGVGETKIDLTDVQVSDLNVYGGTGELDLVLPAGTYAAKVSGGVGEFDVRVPAGATVDLDVRAGTGEVDLDIGAGAAVNAIIKGGVGEFKVRVPAGAAVRVEATLGLGDVQLPPNFTRLSGENAMFSQQGVWQTADYDAAERKITLKFEGGVGGLRVK
jgi:predicted membrane protein